jgi:GNAT superfamily N-acetyltransferase
MVRYEISVPAKEGFYRLFETTGWNEKYRLTVDELAAALENSWVCVSAYDGEVVIGFGRIVSDRVVHAMVYDLIVDPGCQNQGVGGNILQMLVNICLEENIRDIQLFSAKGRSKFYLKRGFENRPPDAPGLQFKRVA